MLQDNEFTCGNLELSDTSQDAQPRETERVNQEKKNFR